MDEEVGLTRRGLLRGMGAVAAVAAVPLSLSATTSAADGCHIDHRRNADTVMETVCVGWCKAHDGMVYSRALSYTDLDCEEWGADVVRADAERQVREAITGADRETFIQHAHNRIYPEQWMYGSSREQDTAYARKLKLVTKDTR